MGQPAIQLDTLKFVRDLTSSGMDEAQAEALVSVLSAIVGDPNLATKDDTDKIEDAMAQLATSQVRLEQAMIDLGERVGKLDERVGRLEEIVIKLDERVGRLEEAMAQLAISQARLEEKTDRLEEKTDGLEKAMERLANAQADFKVALVERELYLIKWIIGTGISAVVAISGIVALTLRAVLP